MPWVYTAVILVLHIPVVIIRVVRWEAVQTWCLIATFFTVGTSFGVYFSIALIDLWKLKTRPKACRRMETLTPDSPTVVTLQSYHSTGFEAEKILTWYVHSGVFPSSSVRSPEL